MRRQRSRTAVLTPDESRALAMLRRRPRLMQCLISARPGDCLVMPHTRATSRPQMRIR